MAIIAEKISAQFILNAGDNFYWNGVCDVDDPRFEQTFQAPFAAPSLQVPWFQTLGNHDVNAYTSSQMLTLNTTNACGNISAQVQYTLADTTGKWQFPAEWYNVTYAIPSSSNGTDGSLQMLFLDTNNLVSGSGCAANGTQMQWINDTLGASMDADWVFVVGHHGIYSTGTHGPYPCLVNYLEPLLLQYEVNAHLYGHDHRLEYFVSNNVQGGVVGPAPPVHYIMSGSVHEVDQPLNWSTLSPAAYASYVPSNLSLQMAWPTSWTAQELVPNQNTFPRTEPDSGSDRGGFVSAQLSRDCLCTQWWDSYGNSLYVVNIANQRTADSQPGVNCDDECASFTRVLVGGSAMRNSMLASWLLITLLIMLQMFTFH
jgi:tartrate-resistant acid phosphatase type 5